MNLIKGAQQKYYLIQNIAINLFYFTNLIILGTNTANSIIQF